MTEDPSLDAMGELWAMRIRGAAIGKLCLACIAEAWRLAGLRKAPDVDTTSHHAPHHDQGVFVDSNFSMVPCTQLFFKMIRPSVSPDVRWAAFAGVHVRVSKKQH